MSGATKLAGKTLKVPLNNYSKKRLKNATQQQTTTKSCGLNLQPWCSTLGCWLVRGKLFFSVKNKWRQFDPPQMGTLKYYSTWSHWRLAVKAGTQASEEMGESAGGWEQHQYPQSQQRQPSLSIQNQTVQPQQALQLNHWLNLGTDSIVSRDR